MIKCQKGCQILSIFFMVLTGTLIKNTKIPILVVLNAVPYKTKIFNYYNYSPIPDLFNHHGDNVIYGDPWNCLYFLNEGSGAFKYLKT